MREVVNEPVGVYFVSEPGKSIRPLSISWRGRRYSVTQLSHQFTVPFGSRMSGGRCHVYCLVADEQYFELLLDPLTMVFLLREVHDGAPG